MPYNRMEAIWNCIAQGKTCTLEPETNEEARMIKVANGLANKGGASSWDDLKNKPFGYEFENVFTWSGTATKNGEQLEAKLTMNRNDFTTTSSDGYALIVNGIVVTADYSQVYTYIHEFNSSGKTNNNGDYCKIHIENSNATLSFKSHEWASEGDVPETLEINLIIAKLLIKPLSADYLPKELFSAYSMYIGRYNDKWELSGEETTEGAYAAFENGQTVRLEVEGYGYITPNVVYSSRIEGTAVKYDSSKSAFVALSIKIEDNYDGTFTITAVEKTLSAS